MEVCWLSVIDYHTQDLTQARSDDCLGRGRVPPADTDPRHWSSGQRHQPGLLYIQLALILDPIVSDLICRFSI